MGLGFGIIEFLVALFALLIAIVFYCNRIYTFWEKKNVPGPKPRMFLGSSQNPITSDIPLFLHLKNIYDSFRAQKAKHCGIFSFTSPVYMPLDPDYIKNIMTRDFLHFNSRGMYHNEQDDPLSANLISMEGQQWKDLRSKLSPTFTSGKMKLMFPIFLECGSQMLEAMEKLRREPLDIKEILGCFTTDIIGSCAFGLECNSFKDPNSQFRIYGRKAFAPTLKNILRMIVCINFPNFAKLCRMRFINPEVGDFFMDAVKKTVNYREQNKILRNDFMQILLAMKNVEGGGGLTVEEIAAQAMVFFFAGFETSSTTMNFCLYELAQNQDIQEKIRAEINEVLAKEDGKITYEGVMSLKYMQEVIDETLRKYPAAPAVDRKCTKDYQLPESDTILQADMRVMIPIYALHHDPEYYPNPQIFDPERFSDINKAKKHPFTYLPFGEGPRICIGMRFGLLQTKVGLLLLLKNYQFSLNAKTPVPLTFDSKTIILGSREKIWLDAEIIN